MTNHLPARPNLEHLKRQAKTLLEDAPSQSASQFKELGLDPLTAKLADAQFVLAKSFGFDSWPKLVAHVDCLNKLEGTWEFRSLEVSGAEMPTAMLGQSKLVINGDRFNMLSPEGDYVGVFNIDLSVPIPTIDIDFIEGPEAGNRCEGIFRLESNVVTFCLALMGASRPEAFETRPDSNHALEVLHRVRSESTLQEPTSTIAAGPSQGTKGNPADFQEVTPSLLPLQGEWEPLKVVNSGKALPKNFLSVGIRVCNQTRTTVSFGGQKMVDVYARANEDGTIDYIVASGPKENDLQFGIYKLQADILTVNMADPGLPRPTEFTSLPGSGHTLTEWRKKS